MTEVTSTMTIIGIYTTVGEKDSETVTFDDKPQQIIDKSTRIITS